MILEKSNRPGGAIRSTQQEGYLAEWGPHGFLDNVAESRELLLDLKLDKEMLKAPLKKFLRYICLNGSLVTIPQTPPKIIRSNILTPLAKLRVLADLWKKPRPGEHSIADWAVYRFGKSVLPFVDILLTGTYAGDMNQLSIDAAMPGLRKLELENGSVLRGAIKTKKQKKGSGMPSMISFEQGMERLIEVLAADCSVGLNSAVNSIKKEKNGWKVQTNQEEYKAPKLVLALHINQALPFLGTLDSSAQKTVAEGKVYNVVMGFGSEAEIPFGFGYLSPRTENRFALGALFSSHMFPGRTPKRKLMLEALIGGTRNPERLEMEDKVLIEKTYQDIRQLLNLPHPPEFATVMRTEIGIPQLEIGHSKLQKYRDGLEKKLPSFHICGFGWEGIGMNEMIKHAKTTAIKLLEGKTGVKQPVEAKGVYF